MELPFLGLTLAGLLMLSGFFSGSETALFSLEPLRLREMAKSRRPRERAVARAMENPRDILVTILVGNMVVNILASAISTAAAIDLLQSTGAGIVAATGVMTFLTLVVGEIAPKTVAYHHADAIAQFVARPLLVMGILITPVRWPLLRLTDLVLGKHSKPDDTVEFAEVEAMLRVAAAEGEVDPHEAELVRGVMELGSSPLEDVMTPRTEFFALARDVTAAEAREPVRRSGYSKIPVSTDEPDEMAGYVTAMDLLLARDGATLGELAQPFAYVPEVKPALELLDDFRQTGARIACVVDEHGHLAGIVTLTDLLEEISGEMVEQGDLHKVLYTRLGPDRVRIPGRMEIRYFNEQFGTAMTAEDSETMAGLLIERAGRIPEPGDAFVIQELGFVVTEAEPNRVVSVEVRLPPGVPDAEGDS